MSEQPPKSFSNEQSSYLNRVLKNIEGKLNDIIATVRDFMKAGAILTANIADGAITQIKLGTNVAGNGPLVIATQANMTLVANTFTLMQWAEVVDTNNNFASHRFTPTVPGYYQINAQVLFNTTGNMFLMVMKNSTTLGTGRWADGSNSNSSQVVGVSTIINMNGTTDYIECYVYSVSVANTMSAISPGYRFTAALIRAV